MKGTLTGRCLCGSVRYSLKDGFRLNPYACHCTNCQSRTGSAFSEHMLFMLADIELTGDVDSGAYDQPSGAHSTIYGCSKCKARIYAVNDSQEGLASLRCGTLDNSPEVAPVAHLWVKSKQAWINLPTGAKSMDQQPRSQQEWIETLGIV